MTDSLYLKISCPKCDGHIEYPAQAGGSAIDCPHCGSPIQLPQAKPVSGGGSKAVLWVVVGFILLAGLVVLAQLHKSTTSSGSPQPGIDTTKGTNNLGSNALVSSSATNGSLGTTNDADPQSDTPPPAPKPVVKKAKSIQDLSLGAITLEKKQGSRLVYAVGTMKNNSEYQHFGVRIILDLLDDQGLKIGSAEDYMGIMEPHKNWQVRALVVNPKTSQVRLASIKEESE